MTHTMGTSGPPPHPSAPPSRRQQRWRAAGWVVLGLVGAIVIAGNFVRMPYVLVSPGDATPLDQHVVTISGASTFQGHGEFLYLTVRLSSSDPSFWRWLFANLDDDVTVTKREDAIGCASYTESARLQQLLMRESQQVAKKVALERLGYDVTETSNEVAIVDVACDSPATGRLFPDDEITAVDDQPVTKSEQVAPLVQAHAPGDDVRLTVLRDGVEQEVTVRTGRVTDDPARPCVPSGDGSDSESGEGSAPEVACVGIRDQNLPTRHFPFPIKINTARVSGPSAGLAFTLAIIDELTEGDLTGGRRIAVTGAIAENGEVIPVGGVEQKASVASKAGAALMLVPECPKPQKRTCEAEPARAHANGMPVVIVHTIDEALAALERAGGDPIAPRPDTAQGS